MNSLQKLCRSAILGTPGVDKLCFPTSKCNLSAALCPLNVAYPTRQFLLVGSSLDIVTAGYVQCLLLFKRDIWTHREWQKQRLEFAAAGC